MAQKVFTSDSWDEFAAGITSLNSKMNYTNIAYGTCSTAAATAAKVITVSGNTQWALTAGSRITVKFSYTNTASNPTFNVNGTGAKSVWYDAAVITTSNLSYAGYAKRPMDFVYDGTQFIFTGWSIDSNTTYANTSLGQGYGTCSTAEATTAKAVSLSGYSLAKGGIVAVKFTYAVPASATMNINSKGAKAIYYKGAAITAGIIKAGDVATFIYDGSQYHLISIDRWQKDITDIQTELDTINDELDGKANTSHTHSISSVTNLQSSLDAKQATVTGGASTITSSNLTADRALISNGSGKVAVSAVTSTELGYLDGVTDNIQTQLDDKAASSHTHNYAGSSSAGGAATSANKLATARNINGVGFDGSANITVPATFGITTAGTGAAYTATVGGISSLAAGTSFIMVPHTVSTSTAPTLNVNSLGAKTIRRMVSNSSTSTAAGYNASWLGANKPVRVTYNGTYWIAELTKPSAADMSGTLSISNGGTGATTAAQALTNLGAASTTYVDEAIAAAITTALNTSV